MKEETFFLRTINMVDKVASLLSSSSNGKNNKMLNGKENCCNEMVRALSFFLCQIQKNNYYSETYLTDQFHSFEKFMYLFNSKKEFATKLSVYFQTKFQLSDKHKDIKIKILLDNVWCIESENSWLLEVIENGEYSQLANGKLYCSYEISNDCDVIEMYKEIEFQSLTEKTVFKRFDKDISKYIDTIGI